MLFRFAPRAGANLDPRLDRQIDSTEIKVGRSTHCALRLMRKGVQYEHAILRDEPGGVVVEALNGATVERDGKAGARFVLSKTGDAVRIGPFTLTLGVSDSGEPAFSVMPDALAAQDEQAVSTWYQSVFNVALPNVRLLGFGLSLAIAALFFILPITFAPAQLGAPVAAAGDHAIAAGTPVPTIPAHFSSLWNVGAFSSVHSGFAGDCAHCHKAAFVHVQSSACLDCHRNIGQHADPVLAPAADLNKERCENCHHEHKGIVMASANKQSDCVSCHGDIKAWAPKTHEINMHDFASDHPQFAPALVTDATLRTTERVELGSPDRPDRPDQSGLKFTHATHLKLDKLKGDGDAACATCHMPAPGGVTFKEVKFETSCATCHTLQFEPKHPEWKLPHGNPDEIGSRISGFYAQAALANETFAPPSSDLFAKPGAALPAPAPVGADMVSSQTAAAMMSSIAHSACGQCHVVTPPGADDKPDAWHVAPVFIPEKFEPRSTFSHAAHVTSPCSTCHAARASNGGPLALLPGIKTCRLCHGGEAPVAQRVASSCISCHNFHDDTHPLITPATYPLMSKPASIASAPATFATGIPSGSSLPFASQHVENR